jgi:hypothetical protein
VVIAAVELILERLTTGNGISTVFSTFFSSFPRRRCAVELGPAFSMSSVLGFAKVAIQAINVLMR